MSEEDRLFTSSSSYGSDHPLIARNRLLGQFLFVSLGINLAMVATFCYMSLAQKDRSPIAYDLKPATVDQQQPPLIETSFTNREILSNFKEMAFEQLIAKLNDTKLVEEGFTQRDLALAALVSFHNFDLEKSLPGIALQQRQIALSEDSQKITIFPGLTDQQYQAITTYTKVEKWPIKDKGIFRLLKERSFDFNPSLAETFYLSQEFLAVKTLLQRSETSIDNKQLLRLLLDGTWEMLESFTQGQRIAQDLSEARRQKFLLDYIEVGSRNGAYLLLKIDSAFASKRLNDTQTIKVLSLLNEKTEEAEFFAQCLLMSLRSDAVRKQAAATLYAFAGENIPEKYEHIQALARFIPQDVLKQQAQLVNKSIPVLTPTPVSKLMNEKATTIPSSTSAKAAIFSRVEPTKKNDGFFSFQRKERTYIIQKGDNLWKIGRKYNIDVDKLRNHNKLSDDRLQIGQVIKLPQ